MEAKIKELMCRLSYLLEILIAFLMLTALFAAFCGLVVMVNPSNLFTNPTVFSQYLGIASTIVIGVEFVKMLCTHTIDSVIDIMSLAIARQMITEHTSPLENLFAVMGIAILYLVRKFLYIKQLDKIQRVKILDFLKSREKQEGENDVTTK